MRVVLAGAAIAGVSSLVVATGCALSPRAPDRPREATRSESTRSGDSEPFAPMRAALEGWRGEAERAARNARRLEEELALEAARLEALEEAYTQLGFEARRAREEAVVSREARDEAHRRAEDLEEALAFLRAERDRLQVELGEVETNLLHENVLLESLRAALSERGEDPSSDIAHTRDLQRQVRVLRTESIELKRKLAVLESVLPKEVTGSYELAVESESAESAPAPAEDDGDPASHLVLYQDDVRGLLNENRALITSRLADMVSGRSRWRSFDMALLAAVLVSIYFSARVLSWPLRVARRRRVARSREAERRRIRDLERQMVLLQADLESTSLPAISDPERARSSAAVSSSSETESSLRSDAEPPDASNPDASNPGAAPRDEPCTQAEAEPASATSAGGVPPVPSAGDAPPSQAVDEEQEDAAGGVAMSLDDSRFLRELEEMLDFRSTGESSPASANAARSPPRAALSSGSLREARVSTSSSKGEQAAKDTQASGESAIAETRLIETRTIPERPADVAVASEPDASDPADSPANSSASQRGAKTRPRVPLSVDDLDEGHAELAIAGPLEESSLTEVIESLCDVEFRISRQAASRAEKEGEDDNAEPEPELVVHFVEEDELA